MVPLLDTLPENATALKDALAMLLCWGVREKVYTAYMDASSRTAIMSTVSPEPASVQRLVSFLRVAQKEFNDVGYLYPPDPSTVNYGVELRHLTGNGNGPRSHYKSCALDGA
jgi:hypothetical protein